MAERGKCIVLWDTINKRLAGKKVENCKCRHLSPSSATVCRNDLESSLGSSKLTFSWDHIKEGLTEPKSVLVGFAPLAFVEPSTESEGYSSPSPPLFWAITTALKVFEAFSSSSLRSPLSNYIPACNFFIFFLKKTHTTTIICPHSRCDLISLASSRRGHS